MVPLILFFSLIAVKRVFADSASYRQNAICNNDQLMRWYSPDTGLWSDGNSYWWQAANMLTAFSDLALEVPSIKDHYGSTWESTYNNAPANNPFSTVRKSADGMLQKVYTAPSDAEVASRKKSKSAAGGAGFLNHFYDDEGWWGLALLSARDSAGDIKYLNAAIDIWYDMHAAWNTQSCGGLPWNKDANPVTNAIENGLYIQLGAALANHVGDDQKNTYLNAAKEAWTWFKNTGMINKDGLINDGIDPATCANNGQPTYSYNQGVMIGGLVELYRATGDGSYINSAAYIANAVTKKGSSLLDDNGILRDICDWNHNCEGDGVQFKGVFPRNLKRLLAIRSSDQWKGFLETNARSIWTKDLQIVDGACMNGVYWGGPYTKASASSQSSALDALVGALAVTS